MRQSVCGAVVAGSLMLAASGCVDPRPGEVAVDVVDVVQAVQVVTVPLVSGKSTFVRVHIRSGGGDVPGVGGILHLAGFSDLIPYGSATTTARVGRYDPASLDSNLVFRLDPAMTRPGERSFEVELRVPSGYRVVGASSPRLIRFGPAEPPRLTVYGLRFRYEHVPPSLRAQDGLTSSTYPERPRSDLDRQRAVAENMIPVAALTVDWSLEDRLGVQSYDCGATRGQQGRRPNGEPTERIGCSGYLTAVSQAGAAIDEMFPNGGHWVVVLQPETPTGLYGAACMTARGNHRINLQLEPDAYVGSVLTHELLHGVGLGHSPDVGAFVDPNYPRPDGSMGPFVGLRSVPLLRTEVGQAADGRTISYDIMSYHQPAWVSPYSYCNAMRILAAGQLACDASLDSSGRFALGTAISNTPC